MLRRTPIKRGTSQLKRTPLKRGNKPLPKRSEKQKARMKAYVPIRGQFLKDNPRCQVKGCNQDSVDVHHKLHVRTGKALTDPEYFLAVCRDHHNFIHLNSDWAIVNGYLMDAKAKHDYHKKAKE